MECYTVECGPLYMHARHFRRYYVGLVPAMRGRLKVMALQAYFDESEDAERLVLAGYISTVEKWEQFSHEWAELLPLAPLNSRNIKEFKMSHMMSVPERHSDIKAFYQLIKNHTELAVAVIIPLDIFRDVISWFEIPDITKDAIKIYHNPWFIAWKMMFDGLHDSRLDYGFFPRFFKEDEVIDFIFDERGEASKVITDFNFLQYFSTQKQLYGRPPIFVNSETILPIQAADMLSWEVRNRKSGDPSELFSDWDPEASHNPTIIQVLNHRYYFSVLLQICRQNIPKGHEYNVRYPTIFEDTLNRVMKIEYPDRTFSGKN